jgi:hypothetical protein
MREDFELALMDVLETDYDLDVRRANDKLNRRRNGVATLHFEYSKNGDPENWKVVVNIDYSSEDAMEESVADCESLALAIGSYLEEYREQSVTSGACGELHRRWDD